MVLYVTFSSQFTKIGIMNLLARDFGLFALELNTGSFGSFQSTSFSGPIKTQNKLFKRRSCIRVFENNSM